MIKPVAMETHLLKHRGPAVVFRDYADMAARIDSEALDVTADSVIVLQHAGPIGAPGMPEWGQLPIPPKLPFERGFGVMHQLHVMQANKGCDFDFLEEPIRAPTPSASVQQSTQDNPAGPRPEPEIH